MAQIILDSSNNLIQGDFDNATVNNRTKFKTTTLNATTNVYAVPNGSATSAGFSVSNAADPTNASKITIATNGSTDTQIISGVNGSGTYLPLSFYTNNTLGAQLDTSGNFYATGKMGGVGSVIQVVSATSQSAQATTTSTSYVTTGFSASITPSSSSNKVLVLLSALGRNGSGGQSFYTIYRGATDLAPTRSFKQLYNPSAGVLDGAIDMSILDSPSSTSSVTYTVYFKNTIAGTGYFALDNSMASFTLMEIKA